MSKKKKTNYTSTIGWTVFVAAIIALVYFAVTAPRVASGDLVSTTGIHYHPKLSIKINGTPVTIPNGIGLGAGEKPIHTHDEGDGTLHLEFQGTVKKTDTHLGIFFDIWGKEWTPTSFMGNPIDATHTLTMKVDGKDSTEYRDLLMKDGQKIELVYQTLGQ